MSHAIPRAPTLLAAGVALCVAACPLPQPIAEVARQDGTTVVTPPRIVESSAKPSETLVLVGVTCSNPSFRLSADVEDLDTTEQIEARWFVDYAPPRNVAMQRAPDVVAGPDDPSLIIRALPPLEYHPDPAAPVHVVEVVVSNGFAPNTTDPVPFPNRMAAEGYETQVFRWVFQFVANDSTARCSFP